MTKTIAGAVIGASALCIVVAPEAAIAQEADALDEIIVTAQRREQNLMDVPISVTAWDASTLEKAAIDNITLVADVTPGLVASGQTSTAGTLNFYIRGVGSNAGGDPAVGYYIDEIYTGAGNSYNSSFVDLERIEILKGPQGTLWGRNTTGGAINVVTKRPSSDFNIEMFGELGEYGTERLAGAITGALSETVSGRLTLAGASRDSFTQNRLSTRTDLTEDSLSYRAQLRFQPNDDLTIDLLYGETEDDAKNLFLFPVTNLPNTGAEFVFSFFGIPPNDDLFEIAMDEQPISLYDGSEARLDVNYAINDQYSIRWLSGHNEVKSFRRSDFDGNFLPLLNTNIDSDDEWFSSELQIQYTGEKIDWTAGFYYYDQETSSLVTQDGDTDFFFMSSCQAPNFLLSNNPGAALCPLANLFWTVNAPDIFFGTVPGFALPSLPYLTNTFFGRDPIPEDMSPTGTNPLAGFGVLPNLILGTGTEIGGGYGNLFDTGLITNQGSLSNIESTAIYGQANWRVNDTFSLTFGLRYTDDDKSTTSEVFGTLFSPPQAAVSGSDSRSETTPKIGFEWRPRDNAMLFGHVTSGFKGAGFGTANNVTGEISVFDEETVIAYEVGYKATMADGRFRLDTAAYYYDYTDMQIRLQYASGPITDNMDEVKVAGLDIATDWSPNDNWSMGLSLNFTDSEISKFSGSDVFDPVDFGLGEIDIEGNPLPRAPEWSGNAYINFNTTPSSTIGTFSFGVSANHTDDYNHTQFGNVLMTPAYTLANANITWVSPNGGISINAYGRNVTDEEYVHSSFFTDAFGVLLFPGAPATYGVQFRLNID